MKRSRWRVALSFVAVTALLLGPGRNRPAAATLPSGTWGDVVQITDVPGVFWYSPRISGDGEWVAFQRSPYIYIGRSDGSIALQAFASTAYWSAISADGSRVVSTGGGGGEVFLYSGGTAQSIRPCVSGGGGQRCLNAANESVAISGDGEWLYYVSSDAWPCEYVDEAWQCTGNLDGSREVWRVCIDSGAVTQVTNFSTGPDSGPWWVSTDHSGSKVAFTAGTDSQVHAYSINGDGSGLLQLAEARPSSNTYSHRNLNFISGDGQWILFTGKNASGFAAVRSVRSDGSEQRLLLDGYGCDYGPTGAKCSLNYDGSLIAVGIVNNQTMLLDDQGNELQTLPITQMDLSYDGQRAVLRSTRARLGLGSETDQQVFVMRQVETTLTLSGDQESVLCPPAEESDQVVLPFSLCASEADGWQVDRIGVRASGSGDDQADVVEVWLTRGGVQIGERQPYPADDGQLQFDTGGLVVQPGECLEFVLHYTLREMTGLPCGSGLPTRTFEADVAPDDVAAEPLNHPPGRRLGQASGSVRVGCALNQTSAGVFATIQGAIDDGDTQNGHTIAVCPGSYAENVDVTKSLTIYGVEGREATTVRAQDADADVFRTTQSNTTLEGLTIRGAGNARGILAEQGVAVRHANVTGNSMGIYNVTGDFVAENTQVVENGGPGLVLGAEASGNVYLRGVEVRDNQGDGVGTVPHGTSSGLGATRGLVIEGTNNQIVHNGGHGIHAIGFNVSIRGATQIHDNGGWGILGIGAVSIDPGAMERIHDNDAGGVMGTEGVTLPAGFIVEYNGGPGIIIGGVASETSLQDVKVRYNDGEGIGLRSGAMVAGLHPTGRLTIDGTDNQIVHNGGHGIHASLVNLTIQGVTQIHDNSGWGIQALQSAVTIRPGAMERIHDNGAGGIMGTGGIRLPPGFAVEDNGGPGIVSMDRDLYLEQVRISGNQGDGIGFRYGSLVLTDVEISSNARYGIWAMQGDWVRLIDVAAQQNGLDGVRADRIGLQAQRLILDVNQGNGLTITGPAARIRNGRIGRNAGYGILAVGTTLDVEGVIVHDNGLGGVVVLSSGSGSRMAGRNSLTDGAGGGSSIGSSTIISNSADGIYTAAGLVVGRSNLAHNAGYALVNAHPSATVAAQGNWWGQPGAPGAVISGSVDYAPWSTAAYSLTVFVDSDPVPVPRAVPGSIPVHIQNWLHVTDTVALTIADSRGWLSGPTVVNVTLEEGFGATHALSVAVPATTTLGATSWVTVSGALASDAAATDTLIFQMVAASIADLAVEKQSSARAPLVGVPFTYTLSVTNAGPDSATGVVLTDTLPSTLSLASVTLSQGSCDLHEQTLHCALGAIDDSGAVSVAVVVTPTAGGTISNTARVSGEAHDPVPYDNVATAYDTVSAPTAPDAVASSGPPSGPQHVFHTFVATVSPIATTLPLTYTWQASGQWWAGHVRTTYSISDTIQLMWHVTGTQTITVTAVNAYGAVVSDVRTIVIEASSPWRYVYLPLVMRSAR